MKGKTFSTSSLKIMRYSSTQPGLGAPEGLENLKNSGCHQRGATKTPGLVATATESSSRLAMAQFGFIKRNTDAILGQGRTSGPVQRMENSTRSTPMLGFASAS